MKQIKLIAILLFFSGVMVLYNGCKDKCPCDDPTDPACENYDPCYGKRIDNTFFRVRPGDRGFKPDGPWCELIPCDTFYSKSVRFDYPEGNHPDATYEWQIGSEINPRYGKSFEIDFNEYVAQNGGEVWIPISLTIRIPENSCANGLTETKKIVTRRLFFTNKGAPPAFGAPIDTGILVGHMVDKPDKKVTLTAIRYHDEYYKDFQTYGAYILLLGHPYSDTILFPPSIFVKECENYKHLKTIYTPTANPSLFEKIQKHTKGLMSIDAFYKGNMTFLIRLGFENNGKIIYQDFIGERIK